MSGFKSLSRRFVVVMTLLYTLTFGAAFWTWWHWGQQPHVRVKTGNGASNG